jgi:hypothetical protein
MDREQGRQRYRCRLAEEETKGKALQIAKVSVFPGPFGVHDLRGLDKSIPRCLFS